jgi:hypothetical protein
MVTMLMRSVLAEMSRTRTVTSGTGMVAIVKPAGGRGHGNLRQVQN